MEESNTENSLENKPKKDKNDSQKQIAGAIIVAGIIIAGAILLKGNTTLPANNAQNVTTITLAPVGPQDRTIGNPQAKVTLVLYEDFQCPFCGKFFQESEQNIRDTYVKDGKVEFVYRDFPFLGPESTQAAEAARCAEDQGKFWEYHDYLFSHQNGENQGNFVDSKLENFAKNLGLDSSSFNQCLSTGKYAQVVANSKNEASTAGVTGTPKGFLVTSKDISVNTQNEIIKALNVLPNDPQSPISFYTTKNILSLNGALPWNMVKTIIDILLK